jgi:hypothetical protein
MIPRQTNHLPSYQTCVCLSVSWSKWKARFYTFIGNKYICIASLQLNSNRSCNEQIKLNRFLTIRSKLCK